MSKPVFGRRTAGAATSNVPAQNILFGAAPKNVVLPEGEYELTVEGARVVQNQRGNVSVVPVLKTDDGEYVKVRPMLVDSVGGTSSLVDDNRAALADMAGITGGEQVDMDGLLRRLVNVRVGVALIEAADLRGLAINEIVAAWQL